MPEEEKTGVFISHITEERGTALLLKDLLQKTFKRDLPIFVSSDYESISGGDVWFTTIVNGLKHCAVIVVLLSPDSLERRWVNFEAGVGVGAKATVIPVVTHGLELSGVGHPLTSLHIRSIQTIADVNALMTDVGTKLGLIPRALIDSSVLIAHASQPSAGSGWIGVDWDDQFLAVGGPVLKLPKVDDQTFTKTQADALRKGGFSPHMAHRPNMKPSVDAGHKIVYLTDKKTYRAELRDGDTILVAKRG
jgi:hypothetical protein